MKVLSIPKITSTSLVVLSTLAFSVGVKGQDKDLCAAGGVAEYGADVSYTIHHASIKPSEVFGTSRKSSYEALLQSCRDHGGGNICDINEENRLSQNLLQPQSMKNFTELGYAKLKCPERVYTLLKEFWDKNRDNRIIEDWSRGNMLTNNWLSPSFMVSVQNESLIGGGAYLEHQIWNAARETMKQWTGLEIFRDSSLYGIRIYEEGAILAPHVDRLPLITSAIVCVDQDLDEPWPLEVYGHDGKAHNVSMLPGDMVLYESHSIIHGRPFPLKGRFMANVFIHFYPDLDENGTIVNESGEVAVPIYLLEGSLEAEKWRNSFETQIDSEEENGYTRAHRAADTGDMKTLKFIAMKNPAALLVGDINGWQPLHFGIRSGYVEAVKFLVEHGADITYITNEGTGYSAFDVAEMYLQPNDPVIKYLQTVQQETTSMQNSNGHCDGKGNDEL